MAKDDRSPLNPFTGKKHLDTINDDQFLAQCNAEYYSMLQKTQILDETPQGQLVRSVAIRLINTVGSYLQKIGRYDYVQDYYEWEVHLVASNVANAFCMPGGKIVIYSGILSIADNEESLAFIMGHEMSHALVDHTRTKFSERQRKETLTNIARVGALGLSLFGLGEIGALAFDAANIADISSEYLLLQPHGRDQELEADKLGITLIHLAGYNIEGIPDFWRKMSAQNSNDFDFFSTHPADAKRINAMNEMIVAIENKTDFYSAPILSDDFLRSSKKSGAAQANVESVTSPNLSNESGASLDHSNDSHTSARKVYTGRKFCSSCNSIHGGEDNFCTNCGSRLIPEIKCSKCGGIVGEKDNFCTRCGNRF